MQMILLPVSFALLAHAEDATKCLKDGECCVEMWCTRCCSNEGHYTARCYSKYRCGDANFDTVGFNATVISDAIETPTLDHSPTKQVPEPDALEPLQNLEEQFEANFDTVGFNATVISDAMETPTLTETSGSCRKDGECCTEPTCGRCCSRDQLHGGAVNHFDSSCHYNGIPQRCGPAMAEIAPSASVSLASTPVANVTHPAAPPCVEANQCTVDCARCCSGYGHHTMACGVWGNCRCDSGPQQLEALSEQVEAAPQQVEGSICTKVDHCCGSASECCTRFAHYTMRCGSGCRCDHSPTEQVLELDAPEPLQNLEEPKPDVGCFAAHACFSGQERAVCLDRCCSGVCEQHTACDNLGEGGWRCKGNLEVEDQCLKDGMCCGVSCNGCCSGTSHATLACRSEGITFRCGNAADFENATAIVV